jgi:hypothetical protein
MAQEMLRTPALDQPPYKLVAMFLCQFMVTLHVIHPVTLQPLILKLCPEALISVPEHNPGV